MNQGLLICLAFVLFGLAMHPAEGRPGLFVYDDMRYIQDIPGRDTAAHPDWNPGTGACPLNPTNAVTLAISAATNAFPNTFADERFAKLSLHAAARKAGWYYNVRLLLYPIPRQDIVKQGGWIDIIVRLDGTVPPIKKGEPVPSRHFGGGYVSPPPVVPKASSESTELSPEEQERRRAEIRKNLQEYQMQTIRKGLPPLPVPLTREMDDQLVQEGVLPPAKPKLLTPEEQEIRREEIQKNLGKYQMQVIRQGMPLAPVMLTMEQKEQLEKEGFVFLSNGSISNSVTGFCHPPRPELIPK